MLSTVAILILPTMELLKIKLKQFQSQLFLTTLDPALLLKERAEKVLPVEHGMLVE